MFNIARSTKNNAFESQLQQFVALLSSKKCVLE